MSLKIKNVEPLYKLNLSSRFIFMWMFGDALDVGLILQNCIHIDNSCNEKHSVNTSNLNNDSDNTKLTIPP